MRIDDAAQILRHGLSLGDQRDCALVEVALTGVHNGIVGNDALGQRAVGGKQRARRRLDHCAGQIAHVADQAVDMFQFVVKGGDGVLAHGGSSYRQRQPKRPVM